MYFTKAYFTTQKHNLLLSHHVNARVLHTSLTWHMVVAMNSDKLVTKVGPDYHSTAEIQKNYVAVVGAVPCCNVILNKLLPDRAS